MKSDGENKLQKPQSGGKSYQRENYVPGWWKTQCLFHRIMLNIKQREEQENALD